MSHRERAFDERARNYWWWFGAALFLLLPIDLLTTVWAVSLYGIESEANPFMRWLLLQGPVLVAAVHLLVAGAVICSFSLLLAAVRNSAEPYDRFVERGVDTWLKLLFAASVLIVVNNLAAIAYGESLL